MITLCTYICDSYKKHHLHPETMAWIEFVEQVYTELGDLNIQLD